MKFDIRQFRDFVDAFDKIKNLQYRTVLQAEEADKLIEILKYELANYVDEIYKTVKPKKVEEPNTAEQLDIPDPDKSGKKKTSSK